MPDPRPRDEQPKDHSTAMNDVSCSRSPRESGASDDTSLLNGLRGWLRGLMKGRGGDSVRETLEELIEEREDEETPLDDHERLLLGNILRLRDLTAYDVMVPRADIVAVEAKTSLHDLVECLTERGHSRLPVYRATLDDAIGMVHIKDVLALVGSGKPFSLPKILRRTLFVSPSIRVTDLLVEMRLKRTHMALVVDEYGGIDGLVTIEDLVEQIVGEIEDEFERDDLPDMVDLPEGGLEADGRTDIEDFEARMGQVLTDEEREDIDTLGGLVFYLAGRVPARGELIAHEPSGLEFQVLDADPRRIKRLRVIPRRDPAEPA